MKTIQAIRGMNDILPSETVYWQYLEHTLAKLAASYGYQEIRFPELEQTQLFKRTIGEVTDIVEKEMYTFEDRNGDSLTLRPEGTAGCVRAGIEHGLLYNQQQRLWYLGPMFRHERPQKGRFRQFHQFGIEAFGMQGPDVDAEQIFMMQRFWHELGIDNDITLQINSLGSKAARAKYKEDLVAYLEQHFDVLDEDSRRRLQTNPLRILDSKNPVLTDLINSAPRLLDYLEPESLQHFQEFCALLDAAKIDYIVNPRLVRGLDYYCLTVYEWVTDKLGAQGTVCAGGRYDGLVEQLGGKATPACGFAMGLERIAELVEDKHIFTSDIYIVAAGDNAQTKGLLLAEDLRTRFPNLKVIANCSDGSFKAQFKRADKSGANIALILGDKEVESDAVAIKYLREDKPQETLTYAQLFELLNK